MVAAHAPTLARTRDPGKPRRDRDPALAGPRAARGGPPAADILVVRMGFLKYIVQGVGWKIGSTLAGDAIKDLKRSRRDEHDDDAETPAERRARERAEQRAAEEERVRLERERERVREEKERAQREQARRIEDDFAEIKRALRRDG